MQYIIHTVLRHKELAQSQLLIITSDSHARAANQCDMHIIYTIMSKAFHTGRMAYCCSSDVNPLSTSNSRALCSCYNALHVVAHFNSKVGEEHVII